LLQTYVAYNQYAANRQLHNFSHPNSFIPERYLRQAPASKPATSPRTDNLDSVQPFLVGRHTCIGMKFAWAEMRVVLARLLWAFDLTLKDENDRWDWGTQNTYIFWVSRQIHYKISKRQN
jgi:cytochrome P450